MSSIWSYNDYKTVLEPFYCSTVKIFDGDSGRSFSSVRLREIAWGRSRSTVNRVRRRVKLNCWRLRIMESTFAHWLMNYWCVLEKSRKLMFVCTLSWILCVWFICEDMEWSVLRTCQEGCPSEDVLQPEDHLEFVGSVGAGDRARGVQHRPGHGGHLPGESGAQDPAGRRFSGMERSVCTSHFSSLLQHKQLIRIYQNSQALKVCAVFLFY